MELISTIIAVVLVSLLITSIQSFEIGRNVKVTNRREIVTTLSPILISFGVPFHSKAIITDDDDDGQRIGTSAKTKGEVLTDSQTYDSLVYKPNNVNNPISSNDKKLKLPCIVFLHGAGRNDRGIDNLADLNGEHGGLLPSLLENGIAPREVADNFVVVAPYSQGKRSFYDEPRSQILQCINQAIHRIPEVDPSRVCLFGFSDGATLAVELLTTNRFNCGVICSYGFVGVLPELAIERLSKIPIWVFHSADDAIFDVANSDRLVKSLRQRETYPQVRYRRYEQDPENLIGPARGHTTGISASKDPALFEWIMERPLI